MDQALNQTAGETAAAGAPAANRSRPLTQLAPTAPNGQWPPCWLVVDWPEGQPDPYHIYITRLTQPPTKGRSLRLSRAIWDIERYFQRGKDDLGLDHDEGRSCRGSHHHLVMAAVAYLFRAWDYIRAKKKDFWPHVGAGAPSDAAVDRAFTRLLSVLLDGV